MVLKYNFFINCAFFDPTAFPTVNEITSANPFANNKEKL